jgi:hypothetical protein|nr:MAG TPA: hypothetical protein [Caudoviricetes sp.]
MKKLIIELPDEANIVALAAVSVKPDGAVAKLMVHSHVVNLEDETTELDLKNVWEEYNNE